MSDLRTGPNDPTDRDLVRRFLQTRSEKAFRTLYRRHSPRLYAILTRLAGNPALADEILQDTWITAAEAFPTFRWQSALSTWLTGIAINHLRTHRRRVRAQPELSNDLEHVPDERRTSGGEHLDIERAITRLSEGYRTVLVLYGIYGYSHAEIGDLLGISEGTSKSQLARARQALRKLLHVSPDSSGTPTANA